MAEPGDRCVPMKPSPQPARDRPRGARRGTRMCRGGCCPEPRPLWLLARSHRTGLGAQTPSCSPRARSEPQLRSLLPELQPRHEAPPLDLRLPRAPLLHRHTGHQRFNTALWGPFRPQHPAGLCRRELTAGRLDASARAAREGGAARPLTHLARVHTPPCSLAKS